MSSENIEKLRYLLAQGTGHKCMDDELFKKFDTSHKIYTRVGVFEIFEKSEEKKYTNSFYLITF
jgi:hypothetical protein